MILMKLQLVGKAIEEPNHRQKTAAKCTLLLLVSNFPAYLTDTTSQD